MTDHHNKDFTDTTKEDRTPLSYQAMVDKANEATKKDNEAAQSKPEEGAQYVKAELNLLFLPSWLSRRPPADPVFLRDDKQPGTPKRKSQDTFAKIENPSKLASPERTPSKM